MHGTQGTHTYPFPTLIAMWHLTDRSFINLNTLDAKSAAGSQKATEDALIQETTKEKEKEKESTKKSKKYPSASHALIFYVSISDILKRCK